MQAGQEHKRQGAGRVSVEERRAGTSNGSAWWAPLPRRLQLHMAVTPRAPTQVRGRADGGGGGGGARADVGARALRRGRDGAGAPSRRRWIRCDLLSSLDNFNAVICCAHPSLHPLLVGVSIGNGERNTVRTSTASVCPNSAGLRRACGRVGRSGAARRSRSVRRVAAGQPARPRRRGHRRRGHRRHHPGPLLPAPLAGRGPFTISLRQTRGDSREDIFAAVPHKMELSSMCCMPPPSDNNSRTVYY